MKEISFIGSGAPLLRAIKFSAENKISIHSIFIPKRDEILSSLKQIKLSNNLNISLIETTKESLSDDFMQNILNFNGYVFSINNSFIIDDKLIKKNIRFLNIHNGLLQKYRGIGELCVFAAYCCNEMEYGSTIHKINIGEDIDSGDVLAQKKFSLKNNASFEEMMIKSISNYEAIFKENLLKIINDDLYDKAKKVPISKSKYLYSNFSSWYKSDKSKKHSIGFFSEKYRKLNKLIKGS
tara:strand:- start:4031 stop:4744 length:714 start_codon:yes stop_codon:yes gene_type:complete